MVQGLVYESVTPFCPGLPCWGPGGRAQPASQRHIGTRSLRIFALVADPALYRGLGKFSARTIRDAAPAGPRGPCQCGARLPCRSPCRVRSRCSPSIRPEFLHLSSHFELPKTDVVSGNEREVRVVRDPSGTSADAFGTRKSTLAAGWVELIYLTVGESDGW